MDSEIPAYLLDKLPIEEIVKSLNFKKMTTVAMQGFDLQRMQGRQNLCLKIRKIEGVSYQASSIDVFWHRSDPSDDVL